MKNKRKITSIKITNNFVELKFNDQSKLKISEDAYFEHKFKANMEIDDKMLMLIKQLSNFHNGYLSALNKIKYKDRSEYEIRNHLYDDFKLLKNEVDEIVEKLKRYDFINDDRFSKDLIESNHLKLNGYNKIKSLLVNAKINSDRIEKYLVYDFDVELELALQYANIAIKGIRNKNKFQTENSLRQKLMYRGFKNDIISTVIAELNIDVAEDEEIKLIKKDYEKSLLRYKRKYEGYELRQRLFTYLQGRGYEYEMINDILNEMENNDE